MIRQAEASLTAFGTGEVAILNDLSRICLSMFEWEGDIRNLEEAIELAKQAVDNRVDGDLRLSTWLLNWANGLCIHCEWDGNLEHIDDSIAALREAERLSKQSSAVSRPQILLKLARALYLRCSLEPVSCVLADSCFGQ